MYLYLVDEDNSWLYESTTLDIDEVYRKWRKWTNITAAQLQAWSKSPISRLASIKPTEVINRNLELLTTPRNKWTIHTARAAMRTVQFNTRMSAMPVGKHVRRDIPFSKRDISLINWAYRPPTVDVKKLKYWSSSAGIAQAKKILKIS
jgi:hypothetical protein